MRKKIFAAVLILVFSLSGLALSACSRNKLRTVNFETYDESIVIESIEIELNGFIQSFENPERRGYTFDGWFLDADFIEDWSFDTPVVENITLYAKWTAKSYYIYLEGDELFNSSKYRNGSRYLDSVCAVYDSEMPPLSIIPKREGSTFMGFYELPNGQGKKYYNSDLTSANKWDKITSEPLYAFWVKAEIVIITTVQDLIDFSNQVNSGESFYSKYVMLDTDIDLNGREWTPIGINSNRFDGMFDGNGHTIFNFKITNLVQDFAGLFGHSIGIIQNLGVTDFNVNSNASYIGGLVACVGENNSSLKWGNAQIINCFTADGTIRGYKMDTSTNFQNYVRISVGGLAGVTKTGSFIYGCYSSSNVTVDVGTGSVDVSAGGLLADSDCFHYISTIMNSYSSGKITVTGGNNSAPGVICTIRAGGFIGGFGRTTIENCYAEGDVYVRTHSAPIKAGGFAGSLYSTGRSYDCYSTGFVSA